MEGLQVKCPNCGKIHWETTDKYDPEISPNGSMVRLLNPWLRNSWPIFGDGIMPKRDGSGTNVTLGSEMDCISCLAQLAPSGKLRVVEPEPLKDLKEQLKVPVGEGDITSPFSSDGVCNTDSMV